MNHHMSNPLPANEASYGLKLSGIEKSFGVVRALKGVDFAASGGEVHAIVGENGAGKSTLIGIAAGILPADAGEIAVAGQKVSGPGPSRMRELGIAVAYQHPALATDLTVLENLQLVAPDLIGARGAEEAAKLIHLVATDQLAMPVNLPRRRPHTWRKDMWSRSRALSPPSQRFCSLTSRPSRSSRPISGNCSI